MLFRSECLEILEGSVAALAKRGHSDLLDVTFALAAEMLILAGAAKSVAAAREILQKKLARGEVRAKFEAMVAAQGGEPAASLPVAKHQRAIPAAATGYVHAIECNQLGYAVIALGGGRRVASDAIDFAVGFELPKKIGDAVQRGEPLMIMHYNDTARATEAERMVRQAYTIAPEPARDRQPLIVAKFD